MPGMTLDKLPQSTDPTRYYVDAEPWSTQWRYRFVPPKQLENLDLLRDPGLERLLYFQFLISDEVDRELIAAAAD